MADFAAERWNEAAAARPDSDDIELSPSLVWQSDDAEPLSVSGEEALLRELEQLVAERRASQQRIDAEFKAAAAQSERDYADGLQALADRVTAETQAAHDEHAA